jgi:hypothetical protein
MRFIFTLLFAVLMPIAAASAAPRDFLSREAVGEWIDNYRAKPEPARVPLALRALVKANAFKDPESSGFYVGFLAGVIGSDPQRAEAVVNKLLPLPASDEWVLVRAVAYSGLPDWHRHLAKLATKLPTRRAMIGDYLSGKMHTLEKIELDKNPGFFDRLHSKFGKQEPVPTDVSFGRNPELLDTLWGYYFATGKAWPVQRLISILPWSKDNDSLDRLTIGSSAKFTLASNGSRYPDLLALLKRAQAQQPKDVTPILKDVIHAAETMQSPRIRKESIAAIDELRRKGPGFQRKLSTWGYIGQGAIALGCIGLAAAGAVVAGLPCVIGGAASSAVLNYWTAQ